MYNSDFPISTQSEDALGRASYARNLARTITKYGIVDSLCIGLLGPWGCGKTSILNMMIEEIEEILEIDEPIEDTEEEMIEEIEEIDEDAAALDELTRLALEALSEAKNAPAEPEESDIEFEVIPISDEVAEIGRASCRERV